MDFIIENWPFLIGAAGAAFAAFKVYARRSKATWDDDLVEDIESFLNENEEALDVAADLIEDEREERAAERAAAEDE